MMSGVRERIIASRSRMGLSVNNAPGEEYLVDGKFIQPLKLAELEFGSRKKFEVHHKSSKPSMDIFLETAIEEAKKSLAAGGIPIGSVLVPNDSRQGLEAYVHSQGVKVEILNDLICIKLIKFHRHTSGALK